MQIGAHCIIYSAVGRDYWNGAGEQLREDRSGGMSQRFQPKDGHEPAANATASFIVRQAEVSTQSLANGSA